MTQNNFSRLYKRTEHISYYEQDSAEQRLHKTIITILVVSFSIAGLGWGTLYFIWNESLSALWPYAYSVISLLNLIFLQRFHHFRRFLLVQLLITLFTPFFLMLSLGGYANSGAVIFWSSVAPITALLILNRRQARLWSLCYIALLVIAAIFEGRTSNNMPPNVITVWFVFNITGASIAAFAILQLLASIQSAVHAGQAQELRRAAHTLKSSSADFGATAFAELCKELEDVAKASDIDAKDLVSPLSTAYQKVALALQVLAKNYV